MYTVQYWNEHAAEWRNMGVQTSDYTVALNRLREQQRMCDYTVRFRILLPSAS